MSCDCPLYGVDVLPGIHGGATIYWYFKNDADIPEGATVTVQVARHATDDDSAWTPIGTVLAETSMLTDLTRRTWSTGEHIYYRVVLSSPVCSLGPVPAYIGTLRCEERRLVREILRREYLRHRSGEAQRGSLLKRKYSGTRCTDCVDPDYPDRQINSSCENCYGTGWVGGYFENPDFYLDMADYAAGLGVGEFFNDEGATRQTTVKYVNIPDVQPGDIWVDYQSDHRWLLGAGSNRIQTLTRFGSYVLTAAAECKRLQFADIAYQVPVTRP